MGTCNFDRSTVGGLFSRYRNQDEDTGNHALAMILDQEPIRVETCNGPLCAGKQASEYSIC